GRAPGARLDAAKHGSAVDPRFHHDQVVDVASAPIFRVTEGALQHLLDQTGRPVRIKPQRLERLVRSAATNELCKRPELAGRYVREAVLGLVDHGNRAFRPIVVAGLGAYFFLPPECPLNVRVGANSPSLWPTMSSVTNIRV